jgi:hypothetical protein
MTVPAAKAPHTKRPSLQLSLLLVIGTPDLVPPKKAVADMDLSLRSRFQTNYLCKFSTIIAIP